MNMIQHKTYGPIAALKKEFRKQIIVMCLLPMLLIFTNLDDIYKPLTSILFSNLPASTTGSQMVLP